MIYYMKYIICTSSFTPVDSAPMYGYISNMEIISSYKNDPDIPWLKGNLHAHTKNSKCGHYPLEDVVGIYSDRIMKYDFLAITDHSLLTEIGNVRNRNGMVIFSGVEFKKEAYQTLGINISSYKDDNTAENNHQEIFDEVNRQGGMNIICHPHMYRDDYWPPERLLSLEGYAAVEIFNNNVKMNNAGRAAACDVWDILLSRGRKVYGIASDDFHHYSRCGGGFIMAQSGEKNEAAILGAIRRGAFYSSSGILLKDIWAEGNKIHLAAASPGMPETLFRFIGKNGVLLAEYSGSEAVYAVRGDECYVRAEASREDGAMAWAQPFWISG